MRELPPNFNHPLWRLFYWVMGWGKSRPNPDLIAPDWQLPATAESGLHSATASYALPANLAPHIPIFPQSDMIAYAQDRTIPVEERLFRVSRILEENIRRDAEDEARRMWTSDPAENHLLEVSRQVERSATPHSPTDPAPMRQSTRYGKGVISSKTSGPVAIPPPLPPPPVSRAISDIAQTHEHVKRLMSNIERHHFETDNARLSMDASILPFMGIATIAVLTIIVGIAPLIIRIHG